MLQQHGATPDDAPVASRPVAAAQPPASAAVAASAPAAVAAAPAPAASMPATLLRDEREAWRELARGWNVDAGEAGDPCAVLARQSVQCFTRPTPLALVRQLDRPGVITLDRDRGTPSYALLTAVGDKTATLVAAGTTQTVTLAALAERWSGDWGTLWRVPPGYATRGRDGAEVVRWADEQLDAAGMGQGGGATLRTRLRNFQLAQGLPADGVLGPMTVMQLNRTAHVDEPRLRPLP